MAKIIDLKKKLENSREVESDTQIARSDSSSLVQENEKLK